MNKENSFSKNDKTKKNIELSLFQDESLPIKKKFYILMDLIVSNQQGSKNEIFIFFGIFYAQIISSFFSHNLGIFNKDNSFSDNILFNLQKILRIKDILIADYNILKNTEIILFTLFIILLLHFCLSCYFITRKSFYSYNISFINIYIRIFLYIGYNIILDLCFSNFCFGADKVEPSLKDVKCLGNGNSDITMIIISFIFIIATLITTLFILPYYYDSFFLSISYYAKIPCNYDYILYLSCFFNSFILTQIELLTKKIFLLYHFVISILLFFVYLKYYLYYNDITNAFAGMFHFLYFWTSIFGALFGFSDIKEKGILYLLISILMCIFYLIFQKKKIDRIIIDRPYYKISNQYHLLFYCHYIITNVIGIEEQRKDKSLLFGIIQMHRIECPNPICLIKSDAHIFLPNNNKWSDRTQRAIDDEIFLKFILVAILNYFIAKQICLVDIYINLSFYNLKITGNYCEAIYNYKKVSQLELSYHERFSLERLNLKISKGLKAKLKVSNEQVPSLEYLDVSQFYKYDFLSQNFLDEINNDINLSLDFWKIFRAPLKDSSKTIDFNKVYNLTDKIRITKTKIEKMWEQLLSIYNGVNELFELYGEYLVEMNDDD